LNENDYQRFYDFEWSRRDQITASLGLPVAVISGLGGAGIFVLRTYPYGWTTLDFVFYCLVGLGILSLGVAIFHALRSFTGYEYEKLPFVSELREYYDELLTYHSEYSDAEGDPDADFRAYLSIRLGEAADANARNNIRKAGALSSASTAVIVAIVFLGLSSGPYLLRTIPSSPYQAVSANLFESIEVIRMADKPKAPPKPPVSAKPPPKPEGPKNVHIRDGGKTSR
jgi:hypothetical protein